jgi:hypothetical protein
MSSPKLLGNITTPRGYTKMGILEEESLKAQLYLDSHNF